MTEARQHRWKRIALAASALAGLGGAVAVVGGIVTLDPGGVASVPQAPAGRAGLGSALQFTDATDVRVPAFLLVAGVVLLLAFAAQLAARLGRSAGSTPAASAFVSAAGTAIAVIIAVETGMAIGFAETAVVRFDAEQLFAYFTWQWVVFHLIGALFIAQMAMVGVLGVRRIVLPRLARWLSLAVVVLTIIVTASGFGGLVFLAGLTWVAGLSLGMAAFALKALRSPPRAILEMETETEATAV